MLKKWIPLALVLILAGGAAVYLISQGSDDEKTETQKAKKQKQGKKADRQVAEGGDISVNGSYTEQYEVDADVNASAGDAPDVNVDQPSKVSEPDSPNEPDQPNQPSQPSQPQVQTPETPSTPSVQTPSGPG